MRRRRRWAAFATSPLLRPASAAVGPLFDSINNPVTLGAGIGDTSALASSSLNPPGVALLDQLHLRACAPPVTDFAGSGDPQVVICPQVCQVPQQLLVSLSCAVFGHVIRMNNEGGHPVRLSNRRHLLLP